MDTHAWDDAYLFSYPLLIRLEIHLSLEWQDALYKALVEHLGGKLYRPVDDPTDWTKPENVPTPMNFMNKIILVVCDAWFGLKGPHV